MKEKLPLGDVLAVIMNCAQVSERFLDGVDETLRKIMGAQHEDVLDPAATSKTGFHVLVPVETKECALYLKGYLQKHYPEQFKLLEMNTTREEILKDPVAWRETQTFLFGKSEVEIEPYCPPRPKEGVAA